MLTYLVVFKPFKRLINLLQMVTYEVIILVVNVGVMYLAILDK